MLPKNSSLIRICKLQRAIKTSIEVDNLELQTAAKTSIEASGLEATARQNGDTENGDRGVERSGVSPDSRLPADRPLHRLQVLVFPIN